MGFIVLLVYRLLRLAAGPRAGTVRGVRAPRRSTPLPVRRRWTQEAMVFGAQAGVYVGLQKLADRRLANTDTGALWAAALEPPSSSSYAVPGSSSTSPRTTSPPTPQTAPQTTSLTIGAQVLCLDGNCGEVSRIILDPISRRVTHLVVSDLGEETPGWIVSARMAVAAGDHVQVALARQDLRRLELADPSHVAAVEDRGASDDDGPPTVLYEESDDILTIRPEDQVRAMDGVAGSACGVVTDPRDPVQMTHLLIELGPERRRVAVPMSRVSSMTTGVQLNMSVSQLAELPVFGETAGQSSGGIKAE